MSVARRRCPECRLALGCLVAAVLAFPLAYLGYLLWLPLSGKDDPYGYGMVYALFGAAVAAVVLVVSAFVLWGVGKSRQRRQVDAKARGVQ